MRKKIEINRRGALIRKGKIFISPRKFRNREKINNRIRTASLNPFMSKPPIGKHLNLLYCPSCQFMNEKKEIFKISKGISFL
jgi:hypothetical protein